MNHQLFSDNFKTTPYWWEQAPLTESVAKDLPESVDVLVIGAGYTGLHAALQTARAGMNTLVVDADQPGFGCSSRNGGQISTSIKHNYATLTQRYGEKLACDILTMGKASLDYVAEFVHEENIACDFEVTGRFHGAHSVKAYNKLALELEQPNPVFNSDAYMVAPSEVHQELGTDLYHGGVVFPHFAAVHPAKYHNGILNRVISAGASVIGNCTVESINPDKTNSTSHSHAANRHIIQTSLGKVAAKQVIVATNGYTGSLTPWQQRRVIPIGSYIIATEEIDPGIMNTLFPTRRMLTDSRKLVYYYRPSFDHKRILFGGRVSLSETNPAKSGPKLLSELHRLFPAIKHVRISHTWAGTVAYTFDSLMHCGEQNGLHYAMGYCGSGVGMASYLGKCIGQQITGTASQDIALSNIPFPTRPLYNGTPWFLAPSIWIYRMQDRIA